MTATTYGGSRRLRESARSSTASVKSSAARAAASRSPFIAAVMARHIASSARLMIVSGMVAWVCHRRVCRRQW